MTATTLDNPSHVYVGKHQGCGGLVYAAVDDGSAEMYQDLAKQRRGGLDLERITLADFRELSGKHPLDHNSAWCRCPKPTAWCRCPKPTSNGRKGKRK